MLYSTIPALTISALRRQLAPMLLAVAAPLEAFAEDAALYTRFDDATAAARSHLPIPDYARAPDRIAWFAGAAAPQDLGGLRVRLLDANDAVIAEYDIDKAGVTVQPYPLGQHAHPGPGEYQVETITAAGEAQREPLTLRGDEQLIRVLAPGEGLRNREPKLRVWAGEGGAGIMTRLIDWLGVGQQATRLSLREDLLEAPDVVHAQRLCREPQTALDGLRHLRGVGSGLEGDRPPGLELAQARCALTLGMYGIAADAIAAIGKQPVAQDALIDAVIDLAALDLERGAPEGAIDVLRALEPMIQPQAHPRFLDRLSLALLQAGKPVAAGEVLAEGPHLSVSQIWDKEGAAQPVLAFMLLNYAVTLRASGRENEALSVFDIVGQRDTRGPLGRALRDRANLILGSAMLKRRQGSEAAAAFDRINLDGPRSSAALLGRGWAVLQGPSEQMRRERVRALSHAGVSETALRAMFKTGTIGCFELQHFTSDIGACSGSARFERARLEPEEAQLPQAAMRFWGPLMERDAREPNVLRAHLAGAEAFLLVGEVDRARQLLEKALTRLKAVEARLAAAREHLAADGVPAPESELSPDAARAESDLRHWLLDWASGARAAQLASSRDTLQRLAAVVRDEDAQRSLRTLAGDFTERRADSAAAALDAHAERLRSLRVELRLTMARLYDRAGGS